MNITGKTKVFGVIADPIEHVGAPEVFNPIFEKNNIDAIMIPFHTKPEHLEATVRGLAAMPNIGGVCVTNPHKMAMFDICDGYDMPAELTRSVNVVKFKEDGILFGHNFDGIGFLAGLEEHGHDLAQKNILIIGAGGAAAGIAFILVAKKVGRITIANRTLKKAELIRDTMSSKMRMPETFAYSLDDIGAIIGDQDIIINTTTLGLSEADALPCSLDGVKKDALIADIIMKPAITRWLRYAQEKGLKIHQGRPMFDNQVNLIGKFLGMWDSDIIIL